MTPLIRGPKDERLDPAGQRDARSGHSRLRHSQLRHSQLCHSRLRHSRLRHSRLRHSPRWSVSLPKNLVRPTIEELLCRHIPRAYGRRKVCITLHVAHHDRLVKIETMPTRKCHT
jgi:hypothetical protein